MQRVYRGKNTAKTLNNTRALKFETYYLTTAFFVAVSHNWSETLTIGANLDKQKQKNGSKSTNCKPQT